MREPHDGRGQTESRMVEHEGDGHDPVMTPPAGAEPSPDHLVQRLLDKGSVFRAFVRRRIDDQEVAEDLLQQAFMRAVERAHHLRDETSVVPWFYRILRNTIIDYYRSQGAESRRNDALLKELTHLGEDLEPPFDEVRGAACHCLHDLLPALKPAYGDLIRRIDIEGQSAGEVAADLNITPNNLTVRLHRARHALKSRLEQACGLCSRHGCLNCSCR